MILFSEHTASSIRPVLTAFLFGKYFNQTDEAEDWHYRVSKEYHSVVNHVL
jgi:hypothetical protein